MLQKVFPNKDSAYIAQLFEKVEDPLGDGFVERFKRMPRDDFFEFKKGVERKLKELPEEVALIRLMGMISIGTNVTNSNWGRLIADAKPFVTTGKPNLKQLKEAKTLVVQ